MKISFPRIPVNAPLLPLPDGCRQAVFLRRHKRFSIELEMDGRTVWVHCNDSGAMTGLLRPGAPALVSPAQNPARKLPWTLERIWVPRHTAAGPGGFWAGVNSSHPCKMLAAAFKAGALPFAAGYESIRMEAKHGQSRLDALLTAAHLPPLWVECKNVTMVEDGCACFPDAPSERARKHLLELAGIAASGARAAMFYLAQRPDGQCFRPADFVDAEYAALFYDCMRRGVEMYVWRASLEETGANPGIPLRICQP